MNVFDKHQLRIARDTLKMSDAGALVMGGMTKVEAREFLAEYNRRKLEHSRGFPNDGYRSNVR